MCFLTFILSVCVRVCVCECVCVCVCVEGVGLLELQCTFFGGDFSWEKLLLGGNS